jgi:2',3'-cyclic-nucleotide 2'-phosphodiesterase (5'-nucleotidase family)
MRILIFLLSIVALSSCKTHYWADTHVQFQRVADVAPSGDASITTMIAPYKVDLDAQMNGVLAQLDVELTKALPECTMGNWVVDMMYDEILTGYHVDIDFALQNQGGLRIQTVAPGPITLGKIFEIMPFDNKVTIMTTNGAKVQELMDHIAKSGGWPLSYTLHYTIDGEKATDIKIKGESLDLGKTYRFALPDYIANGGSDSHFLMGLERIDMELYIRDLYVEHLTKETSLGMSQSAVLDQRVKVVSYE